MVPKDVVKQVKKLSQVIDMKLPTANYLLKTEKQVGKWMDRYLKAIDLIGTQQDKVEDAIQENSG